MKFTTQFALYSQTTRLLKRESMCEDSQVTRGFYPQCPCSSTELNLHHHTFLHPSINYNSPIDRDFKFALICLFGRPYYGNPIWFLFLPLVICLNPGRNLARYDGVLLTTLFFKKEAGIREENKTLKSNKCFMFKKRLTTF